MRLALSILLCCALGASGATYYIDFAGGNNANSGTSTGSPWKHSPMDTNATGNAAATTLAAGDVVKFKGGVTNNAYIFLTNGGSFASPLIFDGNFAGDWGTGRAILDGQFYTNSQPIAALVPISNLVVRGFTMQNYGGFPSNHIFLTTTQSPPISAEYKGFGVLMFGPTGSRYANIVVHDCFFYQLGNWQNHTSFVDTAIAGKGVFFKDVIGGLISNNTAMRVHSGFAVQGNTRDVTVYGNDVATNIVWGVDVAAQQSSDIISNIVVRNNRIHDYAQFTKGNWLGQGEFPHTDGIFIRTSAIAATWYPVIVDGNQFWCDNPGASEGGTASIFISEGPSALVINNVIKSDVHTRLISVEYQVLTASTQWVGIYNNTIFGSAANLLFDGVTNETKRSIDVRGNVLIKPSGSAANNIMVSRLNGNKPELDYNVYWDPDNSTATKYPWAFPAYTLWANRMAWYEIETNGIYADPLLVDTTNAVPSQLNLRPTAGSPVLNFSPNLSAYFTNDILGNPRPAAGLWTAGAYQETNVVAGNVIVPAIFGSGRYQSQPSSRR